MKYQFQIKSSFDLSNVVIDTIVEGYKGWNSYEEAEEYAEDIIDIGQLSPDMFYINVITIVELSDIVVGATLNHRLINDYLTVVSDDKAEACTGIPLQCNEILLSQAIRELQTGNILNIVEWRKRDAVMDAFDAWHQHIFEESLNEIPNPYEDYFDELNSYTKLTEDERVERVLREYK